MVDASSLADFEGKTVILTIKDGDDAKEMTGKVDAASDFGLAFKESGKRDVQLVEPDQIVEIALAPTKPKSLTQKKIKLVTPSTVRQHLLDRHGATRSAVNKLSDDEAFAQHEKIDHTDLGHKHVAAEAESKDEAGTES